MSPKKVTKMNKGEKDREKLITVEAPVSEHPWDVKKVFVPGAGLLQECKNTEFVWELPKTGFCEGGHKWSCLLTRVSIMRASTITNTLLPVSQD